MTTLSVQHIEIRVSSLQVAKEFYVDRLGLQVIEEIPAVNLLALKAGTVRVSIFGGFIPPGNTADNSTGMHVVFRTGNIIETLAALQKNGLQFPEGIKEAPGFIKFISTKDPDGNIIEIGEYIREPV